MTHPPATAFADYVLGSLAGPAAADFESHVAECDVCVATLQREARLEMRLGEAARNVEADVRWGSGKRSWMPRLTGWSAIGAFAAVVAAVMLLNPTGSDRAIAPTEQAPPADAVVPVAIEQRLARNDTVALDGLDESMAGSELGDAESAATGAMQ